MDDLFIIELLRRNMPTEKVLAVKIEEHNVEDIAKRWRNLEYSKTLHAVRVVGMPTWYVSGAWVVSAPDSDTATTIDENVLFAQYYINPGMPVPAKLKEPEKLTGKYYSNWMPNHIVEAVQFTDAAKGTEIGQYWANVRYDDEHNLLATNSDTSDRLNWTVGAWFISEIDDELCYAVSDAQFHESYSRVGAAQEWYYDVDYLRYVRVDEQGVKHYMDRDKLLQNHTFIPPKIKSTRSDILNGMMAVESSINARALAENWALYSPPAPESSEFFTDTFEGEVGDFGQPFTKIQGQARLDKSDGQQVTQTAYMANVQFLNDAIAEREENGVSSETARNFKNAIEENAPYLDNIKYLNQLEIEPQYAEISTELYQNLLGNFKETPMTDRVYLNPMQDDVRMFHETYGQPAPREVQALPEDRKDLRVKLIEEELQELREALDNDDVVETVDAAVDILYVTLGLLVEMGVDAQKIFNEVQASNMSKLGEDGKPILSRGEELDGLPLGKVIKGPNYFKPDLVEVLVEHLGWRPAELFGEDMPEGYPVDPKTESGLS